MPDKSPNRGVIGLRCLQGSRQARATIAVPECFHGDEAFPCLTEKIGLRFQSEFFNIFNHPNFGNPNNNLTNSLFGRSTQVLANSLGAGGTNGGFNPLYQIGGPRSIELALKLQF